MQRRWGYGVVFVLGSLVGGLGGGVLVGLHWRRHLADWYVGGVADQANVAREIYSGQSSRLAERIRASLPEYVRALQSEFGNTPGKDAALWLVSDAYYASGQGPPPGVESVLARLPPREMCRKGSTGAGMSRALPPGGATGAPAPGLTIPESEAVDAFVKSQEVTGGKETRIERRDARQYVVGTPGGGVPSLLFVRYRLEGGNDWQLFLVAFDRSTVRPLAHTRVGGRGYREVDLVRAHPNGIEIDVKHKLTYSLVDGALQEAEGVVDSMPMAPPERARKFRKER